MVIVKKLSVNDLNKNKKVIYEKSDMITYTITKNKNTFFVSTNFDKVYQGDLESVYRYIISTKLYYKKKIKDYKKPQKNTSTSISGGSSKG